MEIYFSGTWGTITDSDWTSDDAQVVCRKLGHFKTGAKVFYIIIIYSVIRITSRLKGIQANAVKMVLHPLLRLVTHNGTISTLMCIITFYLYVVHCVGGSKPPRTL